MVGRMVRAVILFLLFVFSLLSGNAVAQQPSLDEILDSLAGAHGIRQVAISPDAQRVAWVVADGPHPHGIFECSLASPASTQRRITAESGDEAPDEYEIAWSPDSHELAFLSNARTPDQMQLYVAKVAGGEARRLTDVRGSLDSPSWSPDGRTLALLLIEDAPRLPGPLEPMTPPSGMIGSKIYEQRLTTIDVASGHVHKLSPADVYVYEYDWSPAGKSFAVTAAHGAGDANWFVAELYTIQADSGEMKLLYKPQQQIAMPRWSADGSTVAFISGLMSDQGSTGGDVFVLRTSGARPVISLQI